MFLNPGPGRPPTLHMRFVSLIKHTFHSFTSPYIVLASWVHYISNQKMVSRLKNPQSNRVKARRDTAAAAGYAHINIVIFVTLYNNNDYFCLIAMVGVGLDIINTI